MPTGRGDGEGEDLVHRCEEREALAYNRLMRHCSCGRLLAGRLGHR
jgi:hypothetical protein